MPLIYSGIANLCGCACAYLEAWGAFRSKRKQRNVLQNMFVCIVAGLRIYEINCCLLVLHQTHVDCCRHSWPCKCCYLNIICPYLMNACLPMTLCFVHSLNEPSPNRSKGMICNSYIHCFLTYYAVHVPTRSP